MDDRTLREWNGDLWEVLPESGYVPRQTENWVRYQDDEMRDRALVLTAQRDVQMRIDPAATSEQAWGEVYATTGHPRVYIREVPHAESTGNSNVAGPRGVYELLAWLGEGIEGRAQPGSMYRALIRPSARWYQEMLTAAQMDLAGIDREDESLRDSIRAMEDAVEYNQRAHAIASRSAEELGIVEMQRAIAAEGSA